MAVALGTPIRFVMALQKCRKCFHTFSVFVLLVLIRDVTLNTSRNLLVITFMITFPLSGDSSSPLDTIHASWRCCFIVSVYPTVASLRKTGAYIPLKQFQGWGPTPTPLDITVIPRGGVLQTPVMTRGGAGPTYT